MREREAEEAAAMASQMGVDPSLLQVPGEASGAWQRALMLGAQQRRN